MTQGLAKPAGLIPRKPTVEGEPTPSRHPLTFLRWIRVEDSQLGRGEGLQRMWRVMKRVLTG